MEINRESDFDIDYNIKDVELAQVRGCLILYLLDLMDFEYQKRAWIKEGNNISFHEEINYAEEMLFDDLDLRDYLEKKEMPYDRIGEFLKTKEEAEALYKVAEASWPMVTDCYTNDDYLTSAYLPKLHKAAREAFEAFMENEKDNKEFCNFIEELKKKEGRK